MKIEFRRTRDGGARRVNLYVGGVHVTSTSERHVDSTDWKNATEATHACREELQKWIDEEDLPELPADYRVKRDRYESGDVDLIHIGFGVISTILPQELKEDLERQAKEHEVAAKFFRWAAERKGK